MLGHDLKMSCAKFQGNRFRIDGRNQRKACAPDNCVIDYRVRRKRTSMDVGAVYIRRDLRKSTMPLVKNKQTNN